MAYILQSCLQEGDMESIFSLFVKSLYATEPPGQGLLLLLHFSRPIAQACLSCQLFRNLLYLCLQCIKASCFSFSCESSQAHVNVLYNLYVFLLLIGPCQRKFQTQSGTLRGWKRTFSSLTPHCYWEVQNNSNSSSSFLCPVPSHLLFWKPENLLFCPKYFIYLFVWFWEGVD